RPSSSSISSTIASISDSEIGRLAHGSRNDRKSLRRSYGSDVPSRFSTWSGRCSTYSYVVNRRPQAKHSRRRLTARPPRLVRESTTRSSVPSQYGQRIEPPETSAASPARPQRPDNRLSFSRARSASSDLGQPESTLWKY